MRYFLGVGKNFPIAALYGDMGWIPVWITHAFTVLKWWFRLRSYNSNRIANAVFHWSMAMAESECKNWCWQVKQLLVNTIEARGGSRGGQGGPMPPPSGLSRCYRKFDRSEILSLR